MSRKPETSLPMAQQFLVDNEAVVAFGRVNGVNHISLTIATPWAHVPLMRFEGFDFLDVVARAMDAKRRRQQWTHKEAE